MMTTKPTQTTASSTLDANSNNSVWRMMSLLMFKGRVTPGDDRNGHRAKYQPVGPARHIGRRSGAHSLAIIIIGA
ncbi:hypothetical protein [Maricaulis maris]|uniref:hypothetical protein n=1 Tax=Maricaulis maris TaxID=74318 RepID=UPI003B8BFAC7